MEQLAYKYPTKQPINKKIHVGVVGSGDLEILMFPTEKTESTVKFVQEAMASAKYGTMY